MAREAGDIFVSHGYTAHTDRYTCVLYENCISIDKDGRVEHKIWQFTSIVLNSFVLYAPPRAVLR